MSEEVVENGAPAPEPEQSVQEPVVEKQPQIDHSATFAELKRRERALRQERNKLNDTVNAEKQKILDEIKKDPMSTLKNLGIGVDQLTDALLGTSSLTEQPSELDMTRKEVQELRAQIEADKRAKQELDQQKQIEAYKNEVFAEVEKDANRYELLLNDREGKELYWNSILQYYQMYGEAPTSEELQGLADKVEDSILERAKILMNTSKLRPKEAVAAAVKEEQEKQEDSAPSFKTLSKNMSQNRLKSSLVSDSKARQYSSKYNEYMEKSKSALINKYFK